MKKRSKVKSSVYAPTTTNLVSQDILYMNMSQHYRQVLNAKSRVDTSAPATCRRPNVLVKTRSRHPCAHNVDGLTNSDLRLIKEVAQTDVTGGQPIKFWEKAMKAEAANQKPRCPGKILCPGREGCPANLKCKEVDRQRSLSSKKAKDQAYDRDKKLTPNKQRKGPADVVERHMACFDSINQPFAPLLLKSTASSRLRESDSYHPPRRRSKASLHDKGKSGWEEQQVIELVQCDGVSKPCPMQFNGQWLVGKPGHKTNATEPSSKVSTGSCDSAYNGGTSSAAESRGPTPEQAPLIASQSTRKGAPSSGRCTPADCPGKVGAPDPGELTTVHLLGCVAPSCVADFAPAPPAAKIPPAGTRVVFTETVLPLCNDEVLYASFSHAITAEILKNCSYSDKGINAIIQRHIEHNKYRLGMERLNQEADSIRNQLGIPSKLEAKATSELEAKATSELEAKATSELEAKATAETSPNSPHFHDNVEVRPAAKRSISETLSKMTMSGFKQDNSNNNLLRTDSDRNSTPFSTAQHPPDVDDEAAANHVHEDFQDFQPRDLYMSSGKLKDLDTSSGKLEYINPSSGNQEPCICKLSDRKTSNDNLKSCSCTLYTNSGQLVELRTSSENLDNLKTNSDLWEEDRLVSEKLDGLLSSVEDLEERGVNSVELFNNRAEDLRSQGQEEDQADQVQEVLIFKTDLPLVGSHVSPSEEADLKNLQVPVIYIRSSSLPDTDGRRFSDASSEVKPSTNSTETQTDVTGTRKDDSVQTIPRVKPRTVLFDAGVVAKARSDSNESEASAFSRVTLSEHDFDSTKYVDAPEALLAESGGSSATGRGSASLQTVGDDRTANSAELLQDSFVPVALPRSKTKLSTAAFSDTELHNNDHSILSGVIADQQLITYPPSVKSVQPNKRQILWSQDRNTDNYTSFYNPFSKPYYSNDLIVDSNVNGVSSAPEDNVLEGEDSQVPIAHALHSGQESKQKNSKAVPFITPRSFRT